jgi:predicted kinase
MLGRKSLSGDMDEILYQLEYFKEMAIEFECFEHPKAFSNARGRIHFCKTGEIYNPYVEEDFTVTLMVALPGSGKDYYIKNNLSHLEEISLDFFRRENKVKRGDKKREGRIIQKAKNKAKELLRNKQSFVWNATNLSSTIRKPLIDLFHQYKANVRIVYIEPEYKELLKQNNNREYPIPVTAINELIKKIDMPTLSEVEEIIYI